MESNNKFWIEPLEENLYFVKRYIEPSIETRINTPHTQFEMICADCHHRFVLKLEHLMLVRLGLRNCFGCYQPQKIASVSIPQILESDAEILQKQTENLIEELEENINDFDDGLHIFKLKTVDYLVAYKHTIDNETISITSIKMFRGTNAKIESEKFAKEYKQKLSENKYLLDYMRRDVDPW